MTEPLADRIKDIARQIRNQGGGDDDTTRRSTFNILYDIGVEVAALTAANQELAFAFNLAGETCRKLEAERDEVAAAAQVALIEMVAMGNLENWELAGQTYVDAINGLRLALAGVGK